MARVDLARTVYHRLGRRMLSRNRAGSLLRCWSSPPGRGRRSRSGHRVNREGGAALDGCDAVVAALAGPGLTMTT